MEKQRGSRAAIGEILKLRGQIHADEMAELGAQAESAGGKLVSVSAGLDDDWCGTGRIKFPIPIPDPDPWVEWLNGLVGRRINFEVLINGSSGDRILDSLPSPASQNRSYVSCPPNAKSPCGGAGSR